MDGMLSAIRLAQQRMGLSPANGPPQDRDSGAENGPQAPAKSAFRFDGHNAVSNSF